MKIAGITPHPHEAWMVQIARNLTGQPAGIEFAGHSVTSPGMEGQLAADPKAVAAAVVSANPELAWAETSQRGYLMVDLTPRRVTGEWLFMRTINSRNLAIVVPVCEDRAMHSACKSSGPRRA